MAARPTKSERTRSGEFAAVETIVLADDASEPPPAPSWLPVEAQAAAIPHGKRPGE